MAKVNIGAELQALPLNYMLSAPLLAAIEAQAISAHSTIEFVAAVGMDDFGTVRTMDFNYKTSVTNTQSGEAEEKDVTLTVPMLSMLEAPHMAIEDLTVAFEFNIRDVMSKESQFKLSADAGASYENTTSVEASTGGLTKFLFGKAGGTSTSTFKANFNVSTAYQRTSRHETDRRATLKMNMNAKQRVPEGFQRILNIFSDAITAQAELAS